MDEDSGSPNADDLLARGEERERSQRGSLAPAVLTFLIADVRGYTRFTQEHGDEEAGRLAAAFAELAREAILSCGGEVVELRGDEALCVFGSARQALRAAVELQTRFRRRTDEGPAFPLAIGIGLDAGEAVPIEGGYRGGALNTAARLCSIAGPGEILATDTVVSLAQRLEGIRFVARRPMRLKGLEKPVRMVEVVPEGGLPPLPSVAAAKPARMTRRRLAVAGAAALALLAGVVALVVIRSTGQDYLAALEPNAIGTIDADAAGIASQVKLSTAPSAITHGDGFVWIASKDARTVSRLAPKSGTIQALTIGGSPGGMAYGAGSLWVTDMEERKLVQINPRTTGRAVVQRISVGNVPSAVAVGDGAVWVINAIDGTVSRFDLDRGSVTNTIPVGAGPAGIAVGAGAVWVTSEGAGTVLRIDPVSRAPVQAIPVGNGPTGVAVGDGVVWVVNSQDGTVSRIDPATNSVRATVPVGTNPSAVAADAGAVWVTDSNEGTINRVDPRSGDVVKTLTLGSRPSALALVDGTLYATTVVPLAGHRGGVLRVESEPSACGCADPAFALGGNVADLNGSELVYDGLVAYRRVGGPAGATLVPNLAVRLPTPTAGGRTYSFQLRNGIRYSDGTPVRASDFRAAVERDLALNPYTVLGGIVGAANCLSRHGKRCDVSAGIEADDSARTITIRLTQPDNEFLYKLALPEASVVPARAAHPLTRSHSMPGTGPYRVASFDPKREIRLVRNEHFRVWSPDARPDGYPGEVDFRLHAKVEARMQAVESGASDWVSLVLANVAPERQRRTLTLYADRLHNDPIAGTFWLFLNTRVSPFDDVRVRRALNYAIDRNTLVDVTGGLARTTCQILPPSFPGYRPYCPYTRNPNAAGTWTAPDFARARTLVAASKTAGTRVEIVGVKHEGPVSLALERYFIPLLRRLGYPASVRRVGGDVLAYVADSRHRAQIGLQGWFADTLAASNFLQPLFMCASFVPKSAANFNLFEYCNPQLDARMKEAAAVQASDPARADDLWAEVDRSLVDQAVALPWSNPRNRVLVSERVGNYQSHPLWGTLLDQLWVK